jgi:hypothetical protein
MRIIYFLRPAAKSRVRLRNGDISSDAEIQIQSE